MSVGKKDIKKELSRSADQRASHPAITSGPAQVSQRDDDRIPVSKAAGMAVVGMSVQGVWSRAEHVVREWGEGLMGVEWVAGEKCS